MNRVSSFLGTPIDARWSGSIIVVVSVLLLAAVGSLAARLLPLVSRSDRAETVAAQTWPTQLTGHLETEGESWRVTVTGPPDLSVLIISDGRVLGVLTIDETGRGELGGLTTGEPTSPIQLVPLSQAAVTLTPPVRRRPARACT